MNTKTFLVDFEQNNITQKKYLTISTRQIENFDLSIFGSISPLLLFHYRMSDHFLGRFPTEEMETQLIQIHTHYNKSTDLKVCQTWILKIIY